MEVNEFVRKQIILVQFNDIHSQDCFLVSVLNTLWFIFQTLLIIGNTFQFVLLLIVNGPFLYSCNELCSTFRKRSHDVCLAWSSAEWSSGCWYTPTLQMEEIWCRYTKYYGDVGKQIPAECRSSRILWIFHPNLGRQSSSRWSMFISYRFYLWMVNWNRSEHQRVINCRRQKWIWEVIFQE